MQKSKRVRSCLEISRAGSRSSRDLPEATVSDIMINICVIGTFHNLFDLKKPENEINFLKN